MNIYGSLLDTIGNTPLIKVNFDVPAQVYAKLEFFNPGGSIKDRSALYMIQQAEASGALPPGGTIIEASSGNQGIATALIGAIKGYHVIVTVSEKVSKEKYDTLCAYGAEVITCPCTDRLEDPQSYHAQAKKYADEIPGAVMLNQYYNADNAQAHYTGIGPELWEQTNGKITHLIGGVGSGGTICGAGKRLKEYNPAIQVLAVDSPCSYRSTKGNPQPYKLEGLGVDFDAPLLDKTVIHDFLLPSDSESITMLKYLARRHGLLVGPASGAVAHATYSYAKNLCPDDVIVMIFGDSGRAYLSKGYYEQATSTQHYIDMQHNTQHINVNRKETST